MYIVNLNIIFFLLHWSYEIYNLGSINVIVWINISPSEKELEDELSEVIVAAEQESSEATLH